MKIVTPDHWEVRVSFNDDTTVLWRVVAESAFAAEAHVKQLVPEAERERGASMTNIRFPKFVQGHSVSYEVAA